MRYTKEHNEWLKENILKYRFEELTEKFNEKFGTDRSREVIKSHCIRTLKITTPKELSWKNRYTKEEIEFLRETYPYHSSRVVVDMFNKKFNKNKKEGSIRAVCKANGIVDKHYKYTKEEKDWLRENAPLYTERELTDLFNEKFDENLKQCCVSSYIHRKLGLKTKHGCFSKEEHEWLKENFPKDETVEETYQRFVDKFGDKRTLHSMVSHCNKNGIFKPVFKGRTTKYIWNKGLTIQQMKEHYTKENFKEWQGKFHNKHVDRRKNLKLKKDEILTHLGNGEYLVCDLRTYKCLIACKGLHKGEVTKTQVEIIKLRRKLKEIKEE